MYNFEPIKYLVTIQDLDIYFFFIFFLLDTALTLNVKSLSKKRLLKILKKDLDANLFKYNL